MKQHITLPLPLENWWFENQGIFLLSFIRLLRAYSGVHLLPPGMHRPEPFTLQGNTPSWTLLLGLSRKDNELEICFHIWENKGLCRWCKKERQYALTLHHPEGWIRTLQKKTTKESSSTDPLKGLLMKNLNLEALPKDLREYGLIAQSFYSLVMRNLQLRNISTRSFETCKTLDWITPIRLALETNEVSRDQLREIYHFLGHNSFWMKNILSTRKLRKQIPQLLHAIAFEKERQQGCNGPMLAPLQQHVPGQKL